MRKMKPQKPLLQLAMLALVSIVSVLALSSESFAALTCYQCHGNGTNDALPLDTPYGSPATYRNITTGAVKGNHQTHLQGLNITQANQANCARCHNNSGYTSAHRSGTITLNKAINSSPQATGYTGAMSDGGTFLFKNQTSSPTLGTCSNVNCHFETVSPVWGDDPALTMSCGSCHSISPTSFAHDVHLATGQHATYSCNNCHANRANFQHATSAGNTGRNIDLTGSGMAGGTYTLSNFQYLPSQVGTRTTGRCNTIYCHSRGQSQTGTSSTPAAYVNPLWNATGLTCDSCHQSGLNITTGTHTKHIVANNNCGTCHAGAGASSMSSTTHVDGSINVDASAGYSQGTSSIRGNGYGNCATATCHATFTNVAASAITWGTVATCASCHAASPATGAHTLHLAMGGVTCATCHTAPGAVGHINNNIDVSQGAPAVIAKHVSGTYAATCSTVCHSTSTTPVATPTWGAQSNCATCHEVSPTTGAHTTHLTAIIAANCGTCHNGAVQGSNPGTLHGNTLIDVIQYSPDGVAKHAPGVFSATCSTACHNATGTTAVTTPTWGLISNCATCHEASPTTGDHTKHLAPVLASTCGMCHTGATAGVTGGNGHGDGNIDVLGTMITAFPANKTKGSTYTTCTSICHNPYSTTVGITTPTWGAAATCASCHLVSPITGSHTIHVAAPINATCGNCHTGATVAVTGGNNHGDRNVDVSQGYPANVTRHTSGSGYSTCTTICHNAYSTTVGIATPTWGVQSNCNSCHTATPATGSHTQHVNYARFAVLCANCHTGATAGVSGGSNHGDGTVDVGGVGYPTNVTRHTAGSGYSTCSTACHSTNLNAVATPTWGATINCASCHEVSPTSGSHGMHLLQTTFAKHIDCNACHAGVTAGVSGGLQHFDGNIDLAVAEYATNIGKHNGAIGTGYVATCATSYCHGATLPADAVTPKVVPTWGITINTCTACHGYPPNDPANHLGVLPNTCNQCHDTVRSDNTFINPAEHVDGIIQGGKCNACHGYPPVPQAQIASLGHTNNYSAARVQNYSGGGGVHAVAGHLAMNSMPNMKFTPCLTCHPSGATHNDSFGTFSTHHVQVVIDTQFKFDKNRPIVYNGVRSGASKRAGTCTNVACHFQKTPVWSVDTYTKRF